MTAPTVESEFLAEPVDNKSMPIPIANLAHLSATHTGGELQPGEVIDHIAEAITNTPRSLQTAVGPSELGIPCTRRLAYRMAGAPTVNQRPPAWKPAVGSAVHAWLEDVFLGVNAKHHPARWLVEQRVHVGDVGGVPVTGTCDLFDIVTGTVIDFKIVGAASLSAKKKADDPGEQYRTQLQLYGLGWLRRGLPVTRVAILALPQNDELSKHWWWSEPFNPAIAADALTRANSVAALVESAGVAAAAALPTADAFCTYCPYFQPGATDLTRGCPGDADRHVRSDTFTGLVA